MGTFGLVMAMSIDPTQGVGSKCDKLYIKALGSNDLGFL